MQARREAEAEAARKSERTAMLQRRHDAEQQAARRAVIQQLKAQQVLT